MLDGVVSPDAAKLYLRLLLSDGSPEDGNAAALAELTQLGLVAAGPAPAGAVTALEPAAAFTQILTTMDQRIAARHAVLGGLLSVLDSVRLDDEQGTRATGGGVELLSAAGTVSHVVLRSRAAARDEYLAVVAAGPRGEPPLGWPGKTEAARVRLLYAGTHRNRERPPGPATAVRFGPPAPLDIRISDDHTAVLALPGPHYIAAVLVRSEPVVGLLRTCFGILWDRATSGLLTPFDRRVLALLASGHRDADIARCTGTSERTVRRRIAAVAGELGVTSRFAVGVEAYRRGLVEPEPPPAPGQRQQV